MCETKLVLYLFAASAVFYMCTGTKWEAPREYCEFKEKRGIHRSLQSHPISLDIELQYFWYGVLVSVLLTARLCCGLFLSLQCRLERTRRLLRAKIASANKTDCSQIERFPLFPLHFRS